MRCSERSKCGTRIRLLPPRGIRRDRCGMGTAALCPGQSGRVQPSQAWSHQIQPRRRVSHTESKWITPDQSAGTKLRPSRETIRTIVHFRNDAGGCSALQSIDRVRLGPTESDPVKPVAVPMPNAAWPSSRLVRAMAEIHLRDAATRQTSALQDQTSWSKVSKMSKIDGHFQESLEIVGRGQFTAMTPFTNLLVESYMG